MSFRTQLIHEEHERGSWTRAFRTPTPQLQRALARDLVGFAQHGADFSSWLEPSRPEISLIVDLEGELTADGAGLPAAWIAGIADRYTVVGFSPHYACLDLKLTPPGAYRLLAQPLDGLRGQTLSVEEAFGAAGRRLTEQLRDASGWEQRFDALERFLTARIADGPEPTPIVARALTRLQETEGRIRMAILAAELGCSRRHLARRFSAEVGLPPKLFARLIRFAGVQRRLAVAPARWADIAAECGYSDQSHLNRDFRDLAGTTPVEYVSRLLPRAGVIGDEVPFVQDAVVAAA